MQRLLSSGLCALAALWLFPSQASAETPTDCLAQQHVCVSSDGRGLISQGEQAKLEQQIGGDPIYLVVAASGSAGYNSAMKQIIGALSGHKQLTVGFLDSRIRHFGAYNKGMLPADGAADIAARVVEQHKADQNIFAALMDFVNDVQHEADASSGDSASTPSHALLGVLITVAVILVLAVLGFFLIARPVLKRRQRELKEAKAVAQEDLIALSAGITDRDADVSIQNNPEAVAEIAAALSAYERGTAVLDAAKRVKDMGAVSRAIAEGQYDLACAEALAAGRPKPERRPSCFFDPRHGMSVRDVYWAPADGGPGRTVPACSACAHKVEQGIEPEIRKVEVQGAPVNYVNTGFAPAYWGGFGFGPGIFTGFLLGEALASFGGFPGGYGFGGGDYGGGDYGGGDFGGGDFGGGDSGGDFGGGDFDGGDFDGGDFGGGDFGGGDFGGGDFGGGDFGGGDFG
jgi:preprotein translocase subunit YajC